MNDNPERIYLEPECCVTDGRTWCDDPSVYDCEEGVKPTKYIRADLVTTWQPIETAPKEHGPFLVLVDGEPMVAYQTIREPTFGDYWMVAAGEVDPTHWMPLLEPPK